MRSAYLVEDNPAIRSMLSSALEDMAGFEVTAFAETEDDAAHWLAAHCREADVVVLDIELRAGSGLGVLRRRAEFPPGCRFVVLTNIATHDLRRRCLALGAEAVFDKTAELDEFLDHCCRLPPRVH